MTWKWVMGDKGVAQGVGQGQKVLRDNGHVEKARQGPETPTFPRETPGKPVLF